MGIYLSRQLSDSGLVALSLGTVFGVMCAAPDYIERYGAPRHPRDLADHACIRLINPSVASEWEVISGKRSYQAQAVGPIIADNPDVSS